MSRCPSGHESTADDYCDVCGLPIDATGGSPAEGVDATPDAAPADGTPAAEAAGGEAAGGEAGAASCPNCQATNPPNALFCEACGYDFTTGQAPRPVTPSALDLDAPPTTDTPAASSPASSAGGQAPASATTTPGDLAPPLAGAWVAEVWIDPDWYAEQESADPLPSAGVPTVVPLRSTSVLVGRTSRSRNIHPDLDLGTDNGISRRHCQLTSDGTRWWVEDLGSANGTYLGDIVGPLPQTPIPPGEKREISADQRLYVGAWTRIVVRKAAPGEV